MSIPSPDTQIMLDVLTTAVAKALDKKKRLGQYAVIWVNDKPLVVGDDAPVLANDPDYQARQP